MYVNRLFRKTKENQRGRTERNSGEEFESEIRGTLYNDIRGLTEKMKAREKIRQ